MAYVVEIPIHKVEEMYQKWKIKDDLYEKYIDLKEEVEKTDFMTAKYNESLKVINELEAMLDLNSTLVENTYLNATVIGRNLGFWYDKITIDKGSKNGVEENMAVITSDGLIGKVTSVSYLTSDVKLLTSDDINQKISIKIKVDEEYLYGLLTGYDKDTEEFIIEGVAGNVQIPDYAEVTTTGLGDIFPSGILIGYVSTITKDHFDLARTIRVTSKVDFNGISYVTLLKREDS
jgi:rod shape-determining protein MreC